MPRKKEALSTGLKNLRHMDYVDNVASFLEAVADSETPGPDAPRDEMRAVASWLRGAWPDTAWAIRESFNLMSKGQMVPESVIDRLPAHLQSTFPKEFRA